MKHARGNRIANNILARFDDAPWIIWALLAKRVRALIHGRIERRFDSPVVFFRKIDPYPLRPSESIPKPVIAP